MPQPSASTIDQLDRVVSQLDNLVRDVRLGMRSQTEYDALEERAQGIARAIVASFRGSHDRPVNRPYRIEVRGPRARAAW